MSRSRMIDCWARAEEGEIYDEKHFDLEIFWKNLKEVTAEFGICYNEKCIVPTEKQADLLDRIFLAGKQMLKKTGVYCIDTGRVIRFESWEIEESLKSIPDKVILGDGEEIVELSYSDLSTYRRPVVLGRVLGPQSPEIIEKVFESFAKEPLIDLFHFQGILTEVQGVSVRARSPFEMIQEVLRTGYAKDALRRTGRSGAYDGSSAPVTVQAMMVGFNSGWGKKSSDGAHSYLMPPMKTDYDQLCRVFFYHLNSISFWSTASVRIRGMDGPPEMAAVSLVATAIAEQILYQPKCQQFAASEIDYTCYSSRTAMWTGFHAAAAFARNTRCAFVRANPGGIITAGLGEDHFYEVAATALGSAINNFIVSAGTGKASAERDYAAGISARFAGEVAHAGARIDKELANEIILNILSKYEDKVKQKKLHLVGRPFQECYELKKVVPNFLILKEIEKVKREIEKLGFAPCF